jgi:acyl-CoA thioesterase I
MQLHLSIQSACKTGFLVLGTFILVSFATTVQADTIHIIALGASNTAGKGVGSSAAWPAQLAGMLRAKGYDISMTVDGVSGDTSAGILRRADTIPAGTQVVLFDTGRSNDRKSGVTEAGHEANVAQIASRIRARGATPIMVSYQGIPRQPDGIHLTVAGHARVATQLVPRVTAVVGKRR